VLAVVVDLDGVLRRWDPGVLAGAEAAFGLPAGAVGEVAFAPALLSAAVTGRISDPAWRQQVVGQLAGRFGRAAAVRAVARWSASAGEVDEVFGTPELGVAKPDRWCSGWCAGGWGSSPGNAGSSMTPPVTSRQPRRWPGGSPVCVPGRAGRFPGRTGVVGSGAPE